MIKASLLPILAGSMTGDEVQSGLSIVFRGAFNPAAFQPLWFAKAGLFSEGDAEAAEIGVIHPRLTDFRTTDLQVQVTDDRFTVNSVGKPIPDLALDLAIGTFTILSDTPLSMVGVNHFTHIEIDREAAWHEVGHVLAPKDFWRRFFDKPGMQSLTIRNTREDLKRDDGLRGWFDIRVEPSVEAKPFGLFAFVNDHVQIADVQHPTDSEEMLAALKVLWPTAIARAKDVFGALHNLVIEASRGR